MPHAKKELNPLWGLLSEPLFQILAAVGLLLSGVLGLVGKLVSLMNQYPRRTPFLTNNHSWAVLDWVVSLIVCWADWA